MWWNEDADTWMDIIAGAKERLLDAAGLAAEIRPRMSFVSSKRIW
jgi:hypothetical protein